MALWIGALVLGLIYAFLGWGVYLSFRLLKFPDISVDGTFVTGAATTAVLLTKGVNPALASLAGFILGFAAGTVTGVIHTKIGVNDLLAGILVMTGLYSIDLHILGGSNLSIVNLPTLLDFGKPAGDDWGPVLVLAVLVIAVWVFLRWFLRTDYGMSLRASGDNPPMAAAQGISTDSRIIFGLGLSNGLAAISGSLLTQYQGFVDVSMGIGSLVAGIAAVILGEAVFGRRSIGWTLAAVVLGAICFRLMVAGALKIGVEPNDLKLLTACFVLMAMAIPAARRRLMRKPA